MNQEQKQNFKGVNYYRKLLHYDTIVLLIVSILFVIVSAIFIEMTSSGDTVPILLKSILFIIFEIIVLTNKKQIGKIVGVLSVINSSLMIITSLGDGSLFGVVYLLLGIIYLIHSVIYLRKFKESNINYQMTDYENKQNTKLKYLTLIPNILLLPSIFIFIIENTEIRIIVSVMILFINIINVIFCIYLNKKYSKSILVYITMIISILAVLINGVILIDDIGSEIYKKRKNNNNVTYALEKLQNQEKSINNELTLIKNL